MSRLFESLETRRLFSGGVDASYGSATGASFSVGETLTNTTVDSDGRVILVGSLVPAHGLDDPPQNVMFIGRFNGSGDQDLKFGQVAGFTTGTPFGITSLGQVIAALGGGYIATGSSPGNPPITIRFRANGSIDKSFGKNGKVAGGTLLQQSDGKFLVISTTNSGQYFASRYTANGQLDTTYGTHGTASLGVQSLSGSNPASPDTTDSLASALLDGSNRLLVSFSSETTTGAHAGGLSGTKSILLKRFTASGALDTTFTDGASSGGSVVDRQNWTSNTAEPAPPLAAMTVVRGDGQIAILIRTSGDPDGALTVELVGANGAVGNNPTTAALSTLTPGFVVPFSGGNIIALADNSLVIAGTSKSGSTRTSAVIHLNPNLTLDTSFGQSGTMLLPTANGVQAASGLAINTDGTLMAIETPSQDDGRPADGNIVRIFRDDNPVVTFAGAKQIGANERITVSIRGVNPIDLSTLDDNDLRLVDQNGLRKKLHLISSVQANDGTVIASYRISRSVLPAGTYSIRTLASQVQDTNHNGDTSRAIGTILI